MKTKQYLFGTMLLCANAAFISCSSSDDEITTPIQEESKITIITVGAPTIDPDRANTRTAFTDDTENSNGLKISWLDTETIQISSFAAGSITDEEGVSKSFNRQATINYTSTGSGERESATFTGTDFSQDKYKTGDYVIAYGVDLTVSSPTKYGYNTWKVKEIPTEQTQTGGASNSLTNVTRHLKSNYMALLLNVNSYSDVTFSQDWATAHKATMDAHQQTEKIVGSGAVPTTEEGKFVQSSCLKFDIATPKYENLAKSITKIEAIASSNIFYKRADHNDSPVNSLTLNISGINSFGGDTKERTLVGYIMLPAADWEIPAGTTLTVKVYFNNTNTSKTGNISKTITFDSKKTLNTGKLGIIKLKSTGWTTTVDE